MAHGISKPEWVVSADAASRLPVLAQTFPITKYETAVIIGHRALALSQGALPNVAAPADLDVLQTAAQELACNVLPPMRLIRYLPNESHVGCDVSNMRRP